MKFFRRTFYLFPFIVFFLFLYDSGAFGQDTSADTLSTSAFPSKGKFEILRASIEDFNKLSKKKLVLVFSMAKGNKLTLWGWSFHGLFTTDFTDEPDIKLEPVKASSVSYGQSTLFVNYVLNKVKRLQKKFKGKNYVYFIPFVDIEDKLLYFRVIGSNEENPIFELDTKKLSGQTYANPSPPKKTASAF